MIYLVAEAGQALHCIINAALWAAHLPAVSHACNGLPPAQDIHPYLGVILSRRMPRQTYAHRQQTLRRH